MSSGRPLADFGSDFTIRAPFAVSEIVTAASDTDASVGAVSGATAFGFTVTTGTP